MSIFVFCYICYLEICSVRYRYGYTCLSVDAICLENHFSPFTLSLSLSLQLRCASWRQHMGFFFSSSLLLCVTLWIHFIGEFSPFTFRVIIGIWGFPIAIVSCFLVALCLHWFFSFVFLSVVFVWWYSIVFSSVSSFFLSCVSQFWSSLCGYL